MNNKNITFNRVDSIYESIVINGKPIWVNRVLPFDPTTYLWVGDYKTRVLDMLTIDRSLISLSYTVDDSGSIILHIRREPTVWLSVKLYETTHYYTCDVSFHSPDVCMSDDYKAEIVQGRKDLFDKLITYHLN